MPQPRNTKTVAAAIHAITATELARAARDCVETTNRVCVYAAALRRSNIIRLTGPGVLDARVTDTTLRHSRIGATRCDLARAADQQHRGRDQLAVQ